MRLQIAALPPKSFGGINHAEHILVLDHVAENERPSAEELERLREETGAVTVLCSEYAIDVANPVELSADIVEQLLASLAPSVTDSNRGSADE